VGKPCSNHHDGAGAGPVRNKPMVSTPAIGCAAVQARDDGATRDRRAEDLSVTGPNPWVSMIYGIAGPRLKRLRPCAALRMPFMRMRNRRLQGPDHSHAATSGMLRSLIIATCLSAVRWSLRPWSRIARRQASVWRMRTNRRAHTPGRLSGVPATKPTEQVASLLAGHSTYYIDTRGVRIATPT